MALVSLFVVAMTLAVPGLVRAEQSPPTRSAATVAEVLAVCARGRRQGNTGAAAAACLLLTLPCDCGPRGARPPRWCIPSAEPTDRAVARVVAALQQYPRPQAPAADLIAAILAEHYPCTSP